MSSIRSAICTRSPRCCAWKLATTWMVFSLSRSLEPLRAQCPHGPTHERTKWVSYERAHQPHPRGRGPIGRMGRKAPHRRRPLAGLPGRSAPPSLDGERGAKPFVPEANTRSSLDMKNLDVKLNSVSDTSGTHLWLVLMKAHRALARHAKRSIEGLELGFSDFVILELLLHRGPQPVNAIGRRIELTSGAITTAVDRLEARGLVARTHDAEDRRVRTVSLTKEGRRQITAAFEQHQRSMIRAASGLTSGERASLIALVKKLGTTAEEQLRGASDVP